MATPNRKTPPAEPVTRPDVSDFDALLDEPVETPEEKRIRELEAELALPFPEDEEEEFVPTVQLTPEQQRIRDLEDRLARRNAEIAERQAASFQAVAADGRESIVFHVLSDGFTFNGVVVYRGQEFEVVIGSKAYEDTKDRHGNTWLDLIKDSAGQYRRWGKQIFAPGPWPFEQWGSTLGLTEPEEISAAEAAAVAERKRNRAAPVIR